MTITTKIIEKVSLSIVDIFKEKLLDYFQEPTRNIFDLQDKISSHLIEVCNWSERIQFFGMSRAKYTDMDTINLKLYASPRQFRSVEKTHKTYEENSFLANEKNYVLLGDPGSGKTTSLKRLARNLLLKTETATKDSYQYPIVIRLRDLTEHTCIYRHLCAVYGIMYKEEHDKDLNGKIINTRTYIEADLIEKAIPKILNSTHAILLIDGLDEVFPLSFQKKIEHDIEKLARALSTSKIILTCRSGNYTKTIEGFDLFEICDLTDLQVEEIAEIWLKEYDEFLISLKQLPYHDLVNRPLILCQLLHHYDHHGNLPKHPSLIYRRTINLFLTEWDQDRDIKRPSMYSNLDPDIKTEFLSELSYLLTYRIKKKIFDEYDLISAYQQMYENYDLPKDEANKVAKEIETHTGIILKLSNNNYEFSHLSIQEYLCANYIVRSAFSTNIRNYIAEYSAPLAIAVSLSSNSSEWFASLILRHHNINMFSNESLSIFLSRLFLENPHFKAEENIGFAVIKLFTKFFKDDSSSLDRYLLKLLEMKNVRKSISMTILHYTINVTKSKKSKYYNLLPKRKLIEGKEYPNDLEYQYPQDCIFPKKELNIILHEHNISLLPDNKFSPKLLHPKSNGYNFGGEHIIVGCD